MHPVRVLVRCVLALLLGSGVSVLLVSHGDALPNQATTFDKIVTVNIQGGRNPADHTESNAYKWYNADVAPPGSSGTDTFQDRVENAGYELKGVASQEVCRTQWFNLIQRLSDLGCMAPRG